MTQPDRRDERLADERLAGLLHTQRATAKLLRENRGGYDPSWSDHMDAVADELERVASELLALREAQPIDTVPRDGRSVMLWIADDQPSGASAHWFAPVSICDDGSWWDDSAGDQIEPIANATHWRHLPAPPALKDSANDHH